MYSIGEKIYNLRIEKGVSQEKLAEALNVTRQTVSKWERNLVQPSNGNLKYLCDFFCVNTIYFLCENDIAAVEEETQRQIATVEKEPEKISKHKTLKTVATVVGVVLLALIIMACVIATYISISPPEPGYIGSANLINYEGIAWLVAGLIFVSIFITLSILFIKKYIKKRRKK